MINDVITEKEYGAIELLLNNLYKSDTPETVEHRSSRLIAVVQFLWNAERITSVTMKKYLDRIDRAAKYAQENITNKREKV